MSYDIIDLEVPVALEDEERAYYGDSSHDVQERTRPAIGHNEQMLMMRAGLVA